MEKFKWFLLDASLISLGTVLLGYNKSKKFVVKLFNK